MTAPRARWPSLASRRRAATLDLFMDTRLNGEGCDYRTTAHDFGHHDYSIGFRCCADAHQP
jgi:hypothetical protein